METTKLKIRFYPEIFKDGNWVKLHDGEPLDEGQYDFVLSDECTIKSYSLKFQCEEVLSEPQ